MKRRARSRDTGQKAARPGRGIWYILAAVAACAVVAGLYFAGPFGRTEPPRQHQAKPPRAEGQDAAAPPGVVEPPAVAPRPSPIPAEPPTEAPQPDVPPEPIAEPPAEPPALPPRRATAIAELDYRPPETIEGLLQAEVEVVAGLIEALPESSDALALMAIVYDSQGNQDQAIAYWQKALQQNPKRVDAYNSMGMIALLRGEYAEAVRLWRKTLQLAPRVPNVRDRLARALMQLGQPQEAAAVLEEGIEFFPQASQDRFLLGQAYMQLGEYQKAKDAYSAAIELKADFDEAYYGLAMACKRLKQSDLAKQHMERFRKLKAEQLAGKIERAKEFDDLEATRKNVAQTYTDAGRMYLRRGKPRQAELVWRKAALIDPMNVACHAELATLYHLTRRQEAAEEICEQLDKIQPQRAVDYMAIGVTNARCGRLAAAERAFRKVVELAPERVDGLRALATLYLRSGRNLAEALDLAQKAVAVAPTASSYFMLCQARDRNGDRPGALAALKQAMKLDPNNAEYRRVYELLNSRK